MVVFIFVSLFKSIVYLVQFTFKISFIIFNKQPFVGLQCNLGLNFGGSARKINYIAF